MPLPIIILLERHWDPTAAKILAIVLSELKARGYNRLCYEHPVDETQDEILSQTLNTLTVCRQQLQKTLSRLEAAQVQTSAGPLTEEY